MDIKKNLLDLHFHKYLSYKNTTIVIMFMYFVALLIPFLIGELSFFNLKDTFFVGIISSFFIPSSLLFLKNFNYHLKKIPEEIKKLEIVTR